MPLPTRTLSTPRRRSLLLTAAGAAFVAVPALRLRALAQAASRRPTPRQTEGPFYPVEIPADSDADLLINGSGAARYAEGQPAVVEGSVTDLDGRPVRGAVVEIWQCDGQGHYHHPGDGGRADRAFQGFGKVAVDGEGRYRFRTIRPVAYGGRAPHIHVKVKLATHELLTTQLYVQNDPGNARDFLWRKLGSEAERAALTVAFTPGRDGLQARFPIVVDA